MARKFAIDTLARGGGDKEDETPRQIYGKKLEFVYVFGYDHQDHAHKTDIHFPVQMEKRKLYSVRILRTS